MATDDGYDAMNKPVLEELTPVAKAKRLGCFLLLFAFCCFGIFACTGFPPQEFDSASWKAGGTLRRGAMAHSVMAKEKQFIGKTENEIRELFGPPDQIVTEQNGYFYHINNDLLCYISPCDLMIFFNKETRKVEQLAKADW
jgi:hypothetical protein